MAIRIEGKPCIFCLDNCPYQDLYFSIWNLETSFTTVKCQNENLCEMWYEKITNVTDSVNRLKKVT